ncbi:FG-GAP-like repeat-containing protein [Hanstruepera marina]|uniref:FG-GAP-like repeat-containing protein n=1 Tax=Hanstruepera marina TaxID=2873265 RepID=UPI001CA6E892|nr:FG-GAP-like repeat-containing protein [Hanstruepera marina]
MKKTLLILFLFSTTFFSAQNSSDTCQLAEEATAITAPGLFTVDVINGSETPPTYCVGNATNVTVSEWYRYIPAEDTYMTITTDLPQNSGGDTRVHIYSGTCGALVCEGGDDDGGFIGNGYLSIASLNVTGGQTYYIVFDDRWNANGFDFELIEGDPPPPPPTAPVEFTTQNISTTGTNRAIVDMNGDYLDDIVSISSTNINIQEQQSGGGFQETNVGTTTADFSPSWSLAAADYNADGYTDLLYGSGSGVTFMRSNGDGTFTEVSGSEYVFSQRSNFADINNDGHLDAFVCHDVAPNVYYINDGNGNLTFNQGGLGDYSSGGNYGSIWIDFNNDRNLDMFIAKCGGEEARRTNQMHINNGDGTYTEIAGLIGLDDPMQTWSSAWGDFDNDGDMDVFVGASSGTHKLMRNDAGNYVDVTAASGVTTLTATGIENATYDFDNDGNLDIASNGNILFGNGDMTFSVFTNQISVGSFGDLNNDGFIDGFNGNTIHYNDGNANNWTSISTVGTDSNINGIGARVEVHTPSGIQIRDVRSGEGFRYMSTLNTHFGLGTETTIDNIVIYWPSGVVDNIQNPNINEHLVIIEGQSLSVEDEALVNLVIHPNPVGDILYFETPINLNNRIATVFDINGRKVLNKKLEENALNVSKLQTGIYMLRLEYQGKTITRKLIKE